jgi:hypothetical protein
MGFFPLAVKEPTNLDKHVVHFDPPGIPRLMAGAGRLVESDERIAYFSMELPFRLMRSHVSDKNYEMSHRC